MKSIDDSMTLCPSSEVVACQPTMPPLTTEKCSNEIEPPHRVVCRVSAPFFGPG